MSRSALIRAGAERPRRLWLTGIAAVLLHGCGGGGEVTSLPDSTPVSVDSERLAIAERLFAGARRTPEGFAVDAPESGSSHSRTRHLKSTDLDPGAASAFGLCTRDVAEAVDWSATVAATSGIATDVLMVDSHLRYFEIVRQERRAPQAILHDRVFNCDYLDREGVEVREPSGYAGVLTNAEIDPQVLSALTRYLWQFTRFNNVNFLVVSEVTSSRGAEVLNEIEIAQLIPSTVTGACDRIERFLWRHALSTDSRELWRDESPPFDVFSARREAGSVVLC
jgi:hypothetical protein